MLNWLLIYASSSCRYSSNRSNWINDARNVMFCCLFQMSISRLTGAHLKIGCYFLMSNVGTLIEVILLLANIAVLLFQFLVLCVVKYRSVNLYSWIKSSNDNVLLFATLIYSEVKHFFMIQPYSCKQLAV